MDHGTKKQNNRPNNMPNDLESLVKNILKSQTIIRQNILITSIWI